MSDTDSTEKKRSPALSSMLIADLKTKASELGVKGSGAMKKAQLVEAIKGAQGGRTPQVDASAKKPAAQTEAREEPKRRDVRREPTQDDKPQEKRPETAQPEKAQPEKAQPEKTDKQDSSAKQPGEQAAKKQQPKQGGNQNSGNQKKQNANKGNQNSANQSGNQSSGGQNSGNQSSGNQGGNKFAEAKGETGQTGQTGGQPADGDDGPGGRNRRRRGRDRQTRGAGREPDTTILADDVLVPAAGILDVLDSYAFVRTGGYLASATDVYLSLSMVRKLGLRRGDAIVGQVRQPREGERKEKFNPMVRVDTVNGGDPEEAADRPEFESLTAVHPTARLRLERGADDVFGRVVDLLAPIGKGHRGLIRRPISLDVAPVLLELATALTHDDATAHVMVVALNGQPEDVTEIERAIRGEVVACPFDHSAQDQIAVAELAVERAKRLVEQGHDVVMIVDGLSQLGRAYHLQAPASARSVGSGMDPAALQPVKRFFGAGRAVEDGGSLTILATLAHGSVSGFDELIAEEIEPGANWRLTLAAEADQVINPPVDPAACAARNETVLLGEQEAAIVSKVRAGLARQTTAEAVRALSTRVLATGTNIELLSSVQSKGQWA